MQVALELGLDFVECLLVVWCLSAVRHGQRLYAVAGLGVGLGILGRMSRDIAPLSAVVGLQVFGLVLAGLVLAFYLLTVVEEDVDDLQSSNGGV